jgi:tRNA modification GTPase
MRLETDTIAAIATAAGNGGVGVIRLSGAVAKKIALTLLGKNLDLKPRYAHFGHFFDTQQQILDSGLLLYFPAPASYTGEDVVEIQGHGGTVVLNMLLRRVLQLGARLARPGEFTERAFLNGKLDLAQAEAIADLIDSSTEQSVRSAQKSMQGVFSQQINALVDELTELRIFVEAAIDFVDEEIDFLGDGVVESKIRRLGEKVQQIQRTAQQGRLLHDGMTVVLAGKPNAGKSSLLNALAGHEAAIVTEFAGTTRDVLRERIQLDGMPLHIIDTAGLRDSDNVVEKEGIRRAHLEMQKADCIVLLVDVREGEPDAHLLESLPKQTQPIVVYNKIDLVGKLPSKVKTDSGWQFYLSLKPEKGLHLLTDYLKETMGYSAETDNVFIARRRHLDALAVAQQAIQTALMQLQTQLAGELVAEELKIAQNSLAEITGTFTPDDLLGKIFSSFCIGK